MLNENECQEIAHALLNAEKTREPIVKPSQSHPALEMEDAYRIQEFWAEAKTRSGAHLIGLKIGLTSRAMQRTARIAEPDYGRIFSDAVYGDGAQIDASAFIRARVEMELAFVMGDGLEGSHVRLYDVLRATEFVVPALEINDFRTPVPRTIADTVADNAAFGAIVVGSPVPPQEVNLRWVGATLSRNGVIEESGLSAAVMGHPAASVAWLVNKLHTFGRRLEKGQIVLTGSFTRPVDLSAGDVIHADYGPLGTIGMSFA
ncbi:MAG: fumarylacetoacetate hydrolase family protein [Candidatus Accumulibacter sp.]|jgi:2-oxo-hept-3-ene-1,7-dioate hydratase|nr:fumarylacetoacetate hydrolase family protein [Accumulibacter sp.]